ncbi:MAG TPA: hypothetical protein VGV89_07165 [Thermoplasmata archaeon]|nr:hypothetical protein [Thermoplasmata archaeon]
MNNDNGSSFGLSHLSSLPITTSFGFLLLGVLVLLLVLRLVFADISISGRGGAR